MGEMAMDYNRYKDETSLNFDVLKEIGSIGTGNAATALSTVLGRKISMTCLLYTSPSPRD